MEEGQLSNIRVIIAAYNRKEILLNAIKSAVHQTLNRMNYEIIVIKNFKDDIIDYYTCMKEYLNTFVIIKKDFLSFSIAIAFFIVFSMLEYYSPGTSAFDLGINAQSLYAFNHNGTLYTHLLNVRIVG